MARRPGGMMRTGRPALSLLAGCTLLSACGSLDAYKARTRLVGATEPDIVACMGAPASRVVLSHTDSVLQWDYAQTGTDVDVSLGIYALKLGRPGICHAIVRFRRGYVESVHYSGTVVTPMDPDSVCGNLVHDCVWHRDQTALPDGFDPSKLVIAR